MHVCNGLSDSALWPAHADLLGSVQRHALLNTRLWVLRQVAQGLYPCCVVVSVTKCKQHAEAMPHTVTILCTSNKLGQFWQASLLILVRNLGPDLIPASFASSNCIHCKISFFNQYLQPA